MERKENGQYNTYVAHWNSHINELNKIKNDVPEELQEEMATAMNIIRNIMKMNAEVLYG